MNEHSRHHRNTDILEQKRRLMNQRLDKQRARLNARFDQKQAQLNGVLNEKQEQIITAALELLHEGGLNNLGLRDIARRINIQAPAIYWHFKNKEILIDFMAEAILQKEFAHMKPRADDEPWQDWLIGHMQKLRHAMLAYPDGARIVAGAHLYPAVTLGTLLETAFISLADSGLNVRKARHVIMTCVSFAFGYVIEEQSSPTVEEVAAFNRTDVSDNFPRMMESVRVAHENGDHAEEDFMTGINYIIRGSSY